MQRVETLHLRKSLNSPACCFPCLCFPLSFYAVVVTDITSMYSITPQDNMTFALVISMFKKLSVKNSLLRLPVYCFWCSLLMPHCPTGIIFLQREELSLVQVWSKAVFVLFENVFISFSFLKDILVPIDFWVDCFPAVFRL